MDISIPSPDGPIILTDFTGHEDGLQMENDGHSVELYASSERPSLLLKGDKANIGGGILPYIKIEKADTSVVLEVYETGVH